jgi:hypothetical protein
VTLAERDAFLGRLETLANKVQRDWFHAELVDLATEAKQLTQLVREGIAAEGWQPIETAPKDGHEVIIATWGSAGRCCADVCYWSDDDYNDLGPSWRFWRWSMLTPTHWMPLPSPPAATARPEEGS